MAQSRQARPPTPASSPPPSPDSEPVPVPEMSPSLNHFAPAFVRVQQRLQPVVKNAQNPHFGNNFADLASILEEALPLLNDNGFALMQFPTTTNGGQLALLSMLVHESGQFISATMPLLLQKNDPQGEGSAITYGRRYAACAILGIRTADDDGNAGSNRAERPERQERQERRQEAPAKDGPPPAKTEGWPDAAAEAAAHKAVTEQKNQLYALIPENHPVRNQIKIYRDEHGWPMAADALNKLSLKIAAAHGAATAAKAQEGQEQKEAPNPQPEAATPAPEAPSASPAPPEEEKREAMPWDGLPEGGPPPCPWCLQVVDPKAPAVLTGGTSNDDPVTRWHKECRAEWEAEQQSEDGS